VFCRDYETKEWCGLEWKTIRGLLKRGKTDMIMLARFELVEPEDLEGLAGYIDLDHETPESAAALILERLVLNGGNKALSSSAVALPTSFPSTPPEISWPLADGFAVRDAVKKVLCAQSKHRIVLLEGHSGHGKSAICHVLRDLRWHFKWLRCGRFELKGGADVGRALDDFIVDLQATAHLPASAYTAPYQRANALFAALDRSPQPTLLVFDTFEEAGDFGVWVEERVLFEVINRDWLRVVVAGRRLPTVAMPCSSFAAPPVKVDRLAMHDWLEYGRRFDRHLPKHKVQIIYDVAGDDHRMMQTYIRKLCGC
jgi:hypothetical protein